MIITPGIAKIEGFIKIHDLNTGEVLVDKKNAIHYENISIAMAQTLSNRNLGYIYEMAFGNGGSSVDPTGVITYLPPNTIGQNADLYNQTYQKVVDDQSAANQDPVNNRMTVLHTSGNVYTDILVTCLLDYGEPPQQQAFDNSTNFNGEFVFDELGLKVWNGSADNLRLITHVIFHPVQKSLNRQIQIDYTVRIQTLSNINAVNSASSGGSSSGGGGYSGGSSGGSSGSSGGSSGSSGGSSGSSGGSSGSSGGSSGSGSGY